MGEAQQLVTAVLTDRGYPTEGSDQILADLSVEHTRNLENYRAALATSHKAALAVNVAGRSMTKAAASQIDAPEAADPGPAPRPTH